MRFFVVPSLPISDPPRSPIDEYRVINMRNIASYSLLVEVEVEVETPLSLWRSCFPMRPYFPTRHYYYYSPTRRVADSP